MTESIELPARDWDLVLSMVCLTCTAELDQDERMAANHRGHLIIGAHVFRWPTHD